MLYQGFLEPHFRFCCSVWGKCGVTSLCTLEKLQNRVIRIITDSPYDAPAKPLLRQLRLPSIAEMIRQESASMVFKAINGQAPSYFYSLFNSISAVTNRMLRTSNLNLRSPRMKTKFEQNSFAYRGHSDPEHGINRKKRTFESTPIFTSPLTRVSLGITGRKNFQNRTILR